MNATRDKSKTKNKTSKKHLKANKTKTSSSKTNNSSSSKISKPNNKTFATMDGNDPMTQYYLQVADEAFGENRMDAQIKAPTTSTAATTATKPSKTTAAALPVLGSQTTGSGSDGEAIYEGDDELDDDKQKHSNKNKNNKNHHKTSFPSSLVNEPITVDSNSTDDDDDSVVVEGTTEDALDFVDVRLEHVSTEDDGDEEEMGPLQLSDARARASTGGAATGQPTQQEQKQPQQQQQQQAQEQQQEQQMQGQSQTLEQLQLQLQQANNAYNKPASSRAGTPDSSSLYHIVSEGDGTTGNSFSYYRKFASEGSSSLQAQETTAKNTQPKTSSQQQANPSPTATATAATTNTNSNANRRANPLVASLKQAMSWGSGGDGENETTQASSIMAIASVGGDSENAMREPKIHVPNNNTNNMVARKQALQGGIPTHFSTDDDESGPNERAFDFVTMTVSEADSQANISLTSSGGVFHTPTKDTTLETDKKEAAASDDEDNHTTTNDHSDADHPLRDFHQHRFGHRSDTTDEEGSLSVHDYRQRNYFRPTIAVDDNSSNSRRRKMTLIQTMRQNTKANFCAIFLLGVALATLILLVAAKLTDSQEKIFYDEEIDHNIVVTDSERLLTIELLALGLILVLLLGSICYCGAATVESNRTAPLIKQVKHKDACLANASGRREHPSAYQAPYASDDPRRKRKKSNELRSSTFSKDELDHSHRTNDYHDLQDSTFSMLSSATETNDDDNEDVLISMEEADQYYQELEEPASCCSPLTINSTERYTEDEDDDDSRPSGRNNRKKTGIFS